ncbi:hypothetical protein HDU77_004239 [Chytriomyces hyalinus]|nr:hypothetical protein HDU77_001685 [Chytriomyces hyalinus]KAJ3265709.1 hypothetical protein HDU77_004239 [Chytriomyces hyalinus]
MHNPAFFASIFALTATVLQCAAIPIIARPPMMDMPAFYQPNAVEGPTDHPGSSLARRAAMSTDDAMNVAATHIMAVTGMGASDFAMSDAHTCSMSGITHYYGTQMLMGLPIANAVTNVNIGTDGKIMSFHQSFASQDALDCAKAAMSKRDAAIPADQAVLMFAQSMGLSTADKLTVSTTDAGTVVSGASFANQPIQAVQKFYQTDPNNVVPVWDLNINMMDSMNHWANAFVNSQTGQIVGTANWVSDATNELGSGALTKRQQRNQQQQQRPTQQQQQQPPQGSAIPAATYKIIPMGQLSPTQGPNNGFSVVTSPWNLQASPFGWQNANKDLSGNNVIAQSNPNNAASIAALVSLPRPKDPNQNFQATFDPTQGPTLPANRDAATTNAFYVANSMHDILYNYGFTENAGNFQITNNGKGGQGNDPVIANTQDGSGVNNANFASPPDGQPGLMRMYVFNTATPNRDGALENDVVAHEIVHGLSNRLTGGPANANCLQTLESGGMGEGWSDMFGLMVSLPDANTAATPVITGAYVLNNQKGVRNFPYSTSTTTNPLMYSSLTQLNEVHNIGEVWCNMLFEGMWNMIATSGGQKTPASQLVTSAGSNTGNSDLMLLMIAGMKMQPCNPTFIQARNAIIAADQAMFNGKYTCSLWNGFAKRGLGVNASSPGTPGAATFTDNRDIPAGCTKTFQ